MSRIQFKESFTGELFKSRSLSAVSCVRVKESFTCELCSSQGVLHQ